MGLKNTVWVTVEMRVHWPAVPYLVQADCVCTLFGIKLLASRCSEPCFVFAFTSDFPSMGTKTQHSWICNLADTERIVSTLGVPGVRQDPSECLVQFKD